MSELKLKRASVLSSSYKRPNANSLIYDLYAIFAPVISIILLLHRLLVLRVVSWSFGTLLSSVAP